MWNFGSNLSSHFNEAGDFLELSRCVLGCAVSFWHLKTGRIEQSSMMLPNFLLWGSTKTEFPLLCFSYLVSLGRWGSATSSCLSAWGIQVCIQTRHMSAGLMLVGKSQTERFFFLFVWFPCDELGPFTAEPAGHSQSSAALVCLW